MELTLAQAREYLASVGIVIPDAILQLLVNKANSIDACLTANGVSDDDSLLIKYYLIGLLGTVQGDRYVTSQRAPSGAAQSFRYGSLSERYDSIYNLLELVDLYGCATSLIPAKPGDAHAALFIGQGGCGCE
jgi:hypothetical protein